MSGRQNILLHLAFCGTAYHGFQVQKNAPTVCQTLQDAIAAVYGVRLDVKGCSRTDAGVHARDFGLSFFAVPALPCEKIPLALNAHLPADIRVKSAAAVKEDFHARYSALGKEYQYVFLNDVVDDAFCPHLSYRVAGPLDADAMHAAAQCLVGFHDFAAFQAAGSAVEDTRRTLTALSVHRVENRVLFTVAGDGFLYNMVRILAGTLLWVGRGKIPPRAVRPILEGKDRALAGDTLPARGLFLNRVFYPEETHMP